MTTSVETQLVTLSIDNEEVTVPAGTYILQAAEAAGIEVPNLCYQPLLRPWGSCRLCTVEILGQRGGLIESCATPVRDGMEVLTQSPRVVEARQFILQMYLIDHALDCPTCDKSGECYLQDNTYLHNVDNNPYRRPKLAQPYKHFSDFIDYKWDRCIVCARCTRVCDEMVGATAISVIGRSLEAEIGPAYGISLNDTTCTNCGMCIAVCPVGALTDRHFGHHPWEMDTVETICGMCDVGCTINVEHTRGIVRRTSHLWERGVNHGYTCEFGRWGHEHVQDPIRIFYPKIREDSGDLLDVELDEALDYVADHFRHYQGDQFAALASPAGTNEESFSLQRFTRAVMGTNNIDRLMSESQARAEQVMLAATGIAANTAGMQEMMTSSNMVLIVGPDIRHVAPVASYLTYWAMHYREATAVVIGDVDNSLAERSNHWIPARKGTEAALLNAMSRIIIDEGLATDMLDLPAFAEQLSAVDVQQAAEDAGVSVGALREAAILYATGGQGASSEAQEYPASTIWHTLATDNVTPDSGAAIAAAFNLARLTGNIGRPGGGILALRGQANTQGSLDCGCHPGLLPGGVDIGDQDFRTILSANWSQWWNDSAVSQNGFKQLRELPEGEGVGVLGLVDAIEAGRIKAMYISAQSHSGGERKNRFFNGDGPITDSHLSPEFINALEKLEFLVVEDCFEGALTAIADVVLPATMYLEQDGTLTNADRTVQRLRYVVPGPGDSNPTNFYTTEIANRLGYQILHANSAQIFEEIAALVPTYRGISYPRLERGGMQWPVREFGSKPSVYLSSDNGLSAGLSGFVVNA